MSKPCAVTSPSEKNKSTKKLLISLVQQPANAIFEKSSFVDSDVPTTSLVNHNTHLYKRRQNLWVSSIHHDLSSSILYCILQ